MPFPFSIPKLSSGERTSKAFKRSTRQRSSLVTGAVDDLWVDPQGEIMVVDYKATAKDGEVNIDAKWQDAYKRQIEVYGAVSLTLNFLRFGASLAPKLGNAHASSLVQAASVPA